MDSNIKKISISVTLLLIFFFNGFVFGFVNIGEAATGVPSIISYQGRLANASGDLLGSASGTTYYFKFSIWDVATGGTASPDRLWPSSAPTSVALTVRSGVFNANIGDTAGGFPDTLDYDFNTSSDVFLQVEASATDGSFQTLSPRLRISATPFSRLSGAVSGVGQSSFGTTTPVSNALVTIAATSVNSIGATIKGFLSQVANLFQIQSSTGSNLFVVDGSGNVGVGTTPGRKLDVLDANSVPQLRLSQTGSVYGEIYTDSAGELRVSSTGADVRLNEENLWVCLGGACGATTPAENGNIIVETSVILNNNFRLKQTGATTVDMLDSGGNIMLQFDEASS